MISKFSFSANPLVKFLDKEPKDFTKADIIRFITENDIEMVNFRYCGADGRLKTLNFTFSSVDHLDSILSTGERVDGSSLFSFIEAGASDLYVIPRFRTAFLNPFSTIPAVDILCSYFTKDGIPLDIAPENTLRKAHKALKEVTGFDYEVMGELEYYVIMEKEETFLTENQRGYHESSPYNKSESFRTACMRMITQAGGLIKYGHSEVGNFIIGDTLYEQNEIEFLPTTLEDAADQLLIAKWIIRSLASEYGANVTFAPKITVGKAGSGMHVHTRLMKDGKNVLIKDGKLTEAAYKAIAGYLDLAPSISAFGNTNPTSYFRLVPHQEAPTNICWGDMNRSALVRVPLGWSVGAKDMCQEANPLEKAAKTDYTYKQTVEFRCPDGSADIYLLLSALAVAARHGFEMENSIEYAKERYIAVNIFHDENKEIANKLKQLPSSCYESALCLEEQRAIYEQYGVFSKTLIDGTIAKLNKYYDKNIRQELGDNQDKMMEQVERYFHCG